MSSKQILDQFDNLRHCPICKQEFNEPRLIPCGHTFCLSCIEPLQHKYNWRFAEKTSTLSCPVCSKVCDVPKSGVKDFPNNFMANQLKTAYEEVGYMSKYTQCAVCEMRITNPLCCKQCVEYFCESCAKQHRSVFRDHILVPTNTENSVVKKCKIHCNQFVSHYCIQCLDAVCPLCATKHHSNQSNHNIMSLNDAKGHFVAQTTEKLKKLEENRVTVERSLDGIEQGLDEEELLYSSQKCSIEESAERLHTEIIQEKEELLQKIKLRHDENCERLQEAKLNILSKQQMVNDSIKIYKGTVNSLEKDGLLISLEETKKNLSGSEMLSEDYDVPLDIGLKTYSFQPFSNQWLVGCIRPETPSPATAIDELKSVPFADEFSDQDEVDSLSSDDSHSVTRIKEIYTSTPHFITEHVMTSAVDGSALTMVGVGLTADGSVLCAFNAHKVGQVVLSRSSDNQQVIYHRRKDISAFAVSGNDKCGVTMIEDNHVYILSLHDLTEDREATCQYFKHSYNKAKTYIQAIAFTENEEIIISDRERNAVTAFDSQWRRPFNISGKTKNANGTFDNAAALTVGPAGEIIVFDNVTKNLVIFKGNTKYSKTISLDKMSTACSIACHSSGVVFVADSKMNCVVKVNIDNENVQEVLNSESGIKSPSCISVKGNRLAVANMYSFSTVKIKLYNITSE